MMSEKLVPAPPCPQTNPSPGLQSATAYAPGSIGNVGPGFDILGLAVTGAGDRVTAVRVGERGVSLLDKGHPALPEEPRRHAAAIAARAVLRRADALDQGLALSVEKGLPLSGGQGGSAASAAAGAFAANAVLGGPLSRPELVEAALEAEAMVAGRHADNVAPSILGGLVLVLSLDPLDLVELPPPSFLSIVLVRPEQEVRTSVARSVVPHVLPRELAMRQAAHVAALVLAISRGDLELMARALDDAIAEPARAPGLPGFVAAKRAALAAGAIGCSISGSGPSSFAFAPDPASAEGIRAAMIAAYAGCGVMASGRVAGVDTQGARRER